MLYTCKRSSSILFLFLLKSHIIQLLVLFLNILKGLLKFIQHISDFILT